MLQHDCVLSMWPGMLSMPSTSEYWWLSFLNGICRSSPWGGNPRFGARENFSSQWRSIGCQCYWPCAADPGYLLRGQVCIIPILRALNQLNAIFVTMQSSYRSSIHWHIPYLSLNKQSKIGGCCRRFAGGQWSRTGWFRGPRWVSYNHCSSMITLCRLIICYPWYLRVSCYDGLILLFVSIAVAALEALAGLCLRLQQVPWMRPLLAYWSYCFCKALWVCSVCIMSIDFWVTVYEWSMCFTLNSFAAFELFQEESALRYANSCGQLVAVASESVSKDVLMELQFRGKAVAALAQLACARCGAGMVSFREIDSHFSLWWWNFTRVQNTDEACSLLWSKTSQ